jgi:tetratricopeptide (TPR) repeat protein
MKRRLLISALTLITVNAFAQDAKNHVAFGNQCMNEGAYKKASEYYQLALQDDPRNGSIYTMWGFSVHKQKQFKLADSIYTIALGLDSSLSKTFWYKALNHITLRQDSIAIIWFKRFLNKEKNTGNSLLMAYKSIGQCYERQLYNKGLMAWQIDDMLFHYQQIEGIDPNAPEVPMIRAFVEKVQNQRPIDQVGKWKMEAN